MKKLLIIAFFLLGALFISACENNPKTQNSNNQSSNQAASTEKQTTESSDGGHIKIKSENSFDATYDALKKAIAAKEPLTIIAELNHSENATKANMELRPTKVIMFGNPALGTPLMKENQTIGVDLPQKMLVYEDADSNVFLVYNDPKILAQNHNIKGQNKVLDKISKALKGLAEAATKKGEQ